jgi:proteic killer suppression protein
MIKTFKCKETKKLFDNNIVLRWVSIERSARRKLEILHASYRLQDLMVPPGNRLEALDGDRKGQYSIRVNDQFRICFIWEEGNAFNVEIVDYH